LNLTTNRDIRYAPGRDRDRSRPGSEAESVQGQKSVQGQV
jgi:hypothetical protein